MKHIKLFEEKTELNGTSISVKDLIEILSKYPEKTEIRLAFPGDPYQKILGTVEVNNKMDEYPAWKKNFVIRYNTIKK
jgi:hypothetical protein